MATAVMKRLSISIPDLLYEGLEQAALKEGRSMSNLASHLIEIGLTQRPLSRENLRLRQPEDKEAPIPD
jgi:metal-responsive CopG/Arc/MetJ family transcriptional regulator